MKRSGSPTVATVRPTFRSRGVPTFSTIGTYDEMIQMGTRPMKTTVGTTYSPSPSKPQYLAIYLHGDEGGYDYLSSDASASNLFFPLQPVQGLPSFRSVLSFVNTNGFVFMAPQAYPVEVNNSGTITTMYRWWQNCTRSYLEVEEVIQLAFSKYNLCTSTVFFGSASGGSVFCATLSSPPLHTFIST